jgi:opacity protein-like surface antigen
MAIVCASVVGSWTPAAAQSSGDGWDVLVEPYLMGAAMNGAVVLRGHELEIDVSASDIFSNLQFGAMGLVVAKKGNWGFGADLIWMALGSTVRNTNVDFNQGAFAFYGVRQLGPAADVTFGVRVNTVQGDLDFKSLGVAVGDTKTWVDPIAGLSLRTPAGHALQLRVYSEVGGFGAGSDFAWQVFPTLAIHFTDSMSLDLGYRWLDIDYSKGEGNDRFTYDVLTQGPVVGFGFRF